MPLTALVRQLEQVPLTAEVLERIRRPDRLRLQGASRAARALTTSALACCEGAPLLVVVPTLEEAGRWAALLELMGWPTTQLYPTSEGSPYEGFDPTSEITWGQLQVLSELLAIDGAGKRSWRGAIVASERALQPHLPPPAVLAEQCLSLRKGDCVNLEQLGETLARLGYERVATIEQEGTWSRRGDIVDLFPVSAELPVRLEFFGDDLDKLREFDPGTQRSLDGVELVRLTPTSYGPLVAQALREQLPDGLEQLLQPEAMEQLLAGGTPEGMRRLMGLAWNEPSSLLDYLPEHTLVAVDERRQLLAHGQQWFNHVEQHYQDESAQLAASLLPNCLHKPIAAALAQLEAFAGFDLAELAETDNHPNSFELASRSVTAYPNQFGKLAGLIKGFQQDKARVWLLSAQPSRAVALLEEHNCISKFIPNPHDFPAIERLIEQNTPIALKTKANVELEGLQLPAWRLVLITDREFFGQHNLTASGYVRRRRRAASRTVDPNRMQPGDFVVHRNHGIGRFLKLEKLAIAGDARDYLVVQYADGLLRVAADQLGSLGRFRASTDAPPELNRMGGIAWARAKERARKAVRKVALDLVKLYAERLESPGFAFPVDGPWQLELED
ncbi:MAG: transcription-repair coupling factor, partial [Synechococcaceae bacterium WBB_32_011]|nr:transcription-repair coupling factor [Synechococcaceae bacterium WBB_32_011]